MSTRQILAALLAGAVLAGAAAPASAATKHKKHHTKHHTMHRAATTARAGASGTSNLTVTPAANSSQSIGVGPGTGVTGSGRTIRTIRLGPNGGIAPPSGGTVISPSGQSSASRVGVALGAKKVDPKHPLPPPQTNPNAPAGTSGTTGADQTGSANGTGTTNGGTAGQNGGTSASPTGATSPP